MRIQKATVHDLDKILPLVDEAVRFMNDGGNFQWDPTYPNREVFERDISQHQLYIAKDLLRIAGIVCLNYDQPQEYIPLDWKTDKDALVIHRMAIGNTYRGTGIAHKLFEFAETEAKRQNLSAIRSDTNTKNGAMNHLFKAHNYRFTGQIVLRENPDLFNCYEKKIK